jgi:hypothetical protein
MTDKMSGIPYSGGTRIGGGTPGAGSLGGTPGATSLGGNPGLVVTGGGPPPDGTGFMGDNGLNLPPPDWTAHVEGLSEELIESITDPMTLMTLVSGVVASSQMKSHIALKQSYNQQLNAAMAVAKMENRDEKAAAVAGFAGANSAAIGEIAGGVIQGGVGVASGGITKMAKTVGHGADKAAEKATKMKSDLEDTQKTFETESDKLTKNLHGAEVRHTDHQVKQLEKRNDNTKAELDQLQSERRDHIETRKHLQSIDDEEGRAALHEFDNNVIRPNAQKIRAKEAEVQSGSKELAQGRDYLDQQSAAEPQAPANLKGEIRQTKKTIEGKQEEIDASELASNQLKQQAIGADPQAAGGLMQKAQEHDSTISGLKEEMGIHQEKLDALENIQNHREDFSQSQKDAMRAIEETHRDANKASTSANLLGQAAQVVGQAGMAGGNLGSGIGNMLAAPDQQKDKLLSADAKLEGAYEQNLSGTAQMYLDAANNARGAFDKTMDLIGSANQKAMDTNSAIARNTA